MKEFNDAKIRGQRFNCVSIPDKKEQVNVFSVFKALI